MLLRWLSWPHARAHRYLGRSPPGIRPVAVTDAVSPPWGGELPRLDESRGQGVDDEFDPVVAAGFAQDGLDVGLDRRLGDVEPLADPGVAHTLAHEGQNGDLPSG